MLESWTDGFSCQLWLQIEGCYARFSVKRPAIVISGRGCSGSLNLLRTQGLESKLKNLCYKGSRAQVAYLVISLLIHNQCQIAATVAIQFKYREVIQ
jgi:hypothetical protein